MFITKSLESILKSIKIILNNSAFKDNHTLHKDVYSFIIITTISITFHLTYFVLTYIKWICHNLLHQLLIMVFRLGTSFSNWLIIVNTAFELRKNVAYVETFSLLILFLSSLQKSFNVNTLY